MITPLRGSVDINRIDRCDLEPGCWRAKGSEPPYAAWEAAVLPLNYARKLLILYRNSDPPSQFPLSNPCRFWASPQSYTAILTPANAQQSPHRYLMRGSAKQPAAAQD